MMIENGRKEESTARTLRVVVMVIGEALGERYGKLVCGRGRGSNSPRSDRDCGRRRRGNRQRYREKWHYSVNDPTEDDSTGSDSKELYASYTEVKAWESERWREFCPEQTTWEAYKALTVNQA
jgi:hypothetical protein